MPAITIHQNDTLNLPAGGSVKLLSERGEHVVLYVDSPGDIQHTNRQGRTRILSPSKRRAAGGWVDEIVARYDRNS